MSKEIKQGSIQSHPDSLPKQTEAPVAQAPQSVLDTISEQAVVEESEQDNKKTKRPLLPKLSVEMFFDRMHLKRRVKLLIGLYVLIVFGLIGYGIRDLWQKNTELTETWEQREQQYVHKLVTIDLAGLSRMSAQLDTGVQMEHDPVLALFTIEELAGESNVQLLNPSYTINSADVEAGQGIALSVQIHGEGDNILSFLEYLQSTKPLITVESFRVQYTESEGFQAAIDIQYLHTTQVNEAIDETQEKFSENLTVDYPLVGIEKILEGIKDLRVIVMEKIGTFILGKQDLFAS